MHENQPTVLRLRGMYVANVWLLSESGDGEQRRFLIDCGHRAERRALARSLRAVGIVAPGDLTALLLTHRHSDHAGNARWVRERFGCPVVCHPGDAAVLKGDVPAPRLARHGTPWVSAALCRVEDRFPARCPVDETYADGAWKWGFDIIHVGGHTDGSVLLLHRPTGILFTGDALLAGPPVQQFLVRLRLAVPEYSLDAPACHRAVLDYLATEPPIETLCAGHGPKVREGLDERLRHLRAQVALA